jgi:adenylate cyclase
MAIQEGMSERNKDIDANWQLNFRIGINVGDVVAEGNDLLGDGVNIAARLEGLSEPGGMLISDDTYRQVRNRVDINFIKEGPKDLKNIADPIVVWRWLHADQSLQQEISGSSKEIEISDKPSIAVLPIANMSNDPDQEYFSDGITEDITTALSKFGSLFVIARNSTFVYKGRAVDVKQVATDLGVRYVLEGSVRSGGQRMRITGQLIDAEKGGHIWAERYDRNVDD